MQGGQALRDGLELALTWQGYSVALSADGLSAIQEVRRVPPHLALLDTQLPDGPDGFMVARQLRKEHVPVVFLTAADNEHDRLQAFDVDADDYITRPFSMPELLARVGVVLRRHGTARPVTLELDDLCLDERSHRVVRAGHELALTRLEFRLLAVLLRHQGHALSKARLLAEVWDYRSGDPNLVESHISALRPKLEAHGPRIIHTIRGTGYVARL